MFHCRVKASAIWSKGKATCHGRIFGSCWAGSPLCDCDYNRSSRLDHHRSGIRSVLCLVVLCDQNLHPVVNRSPLWLGWCFNWSRNGLSPMKIWLAFPRQIDNWWACPAYFCYPILNYSLCSLARARQVCRITGSGDSYKNSEGQNSVQIFCWALHEYWSGLVILFEQSSFDCCPWALKMFCCGSAFANDSQDKTNTCFQRSFGHLIHMDSWSCSCYYIAMQSVTSMGLSERAMSGSRMTITSSHFLGRCWNG